ncbi:2-hydroxyacid dehydrogenase [Nocardioides sp.]|uniref:2-hydroxyacid dehydrogenase n=1 Tax=Nocardioides sp. TaxID=35761 RepID=UPI003D0A5B43
MSLPLVWLPFEIDDLPVGVRCEVVPDPVAHLPASLAEVAGYVLPYRFEPGDSAFLARAPRLRWVQSLTAGVDHLVGRIPEGVTLCNGRGIHSASTAELAVALMLASLRAIPDFVRAQDRREWVPGERPALADRRVLIIGYGDIGAAIEARLTPFEVEVVRVARTARADVHAFADLPALIPEADVIVLVVPLTEATRHLVDARFLAAMKQGALLVNVARGAVVDTDALVAALHGGRITAALDVTDPEPPPPEHPLWSAPGLLISPHTGGSSTAFKPRAVRLIREQLQRFARDEPLDNVV